LGGILISHETSDTSATNYCWIRELMAMRVPRKQNLRADLPKPQKLRNKPRATGNKRLTEQIRKILGKHYASKYRVR
jgi:hypothetical protein